MRLGDEADLSVCYRSALGVQVTVDGVSYATLAEASAALEKGARGGEVTAVDGLDQIVRRYTADECRKARLFP